MRVCIDIQPAIAQRAGIGRYVQQLVQHLGPLRAEDELRLFFFDFKGRGLPFATPGATAQAIRWCPGRLVQAAWKRLHAPPFDWFSGPADLYHFANFIRPPLRKGKSVVTIHDATFLRFPETMEQKNLRYLNARIGDTVERADAIIAISQFTADELVEHLGLSRDRVFAIPLGLSPDMTPPDASAIRQMRATLGLDRPYLLSVGTIEPRKNLPFLVDLFEQLTGFDGDLVISGMPGWQCEPILERMQTSSRADRIHYVSYVDDTLLPALYAGAELYVTPSLYEGFGFTPLEAMACGTPVVAAAAGALTEVLGDYAILLDHYELDGWVEAVSSALRREGQHASLVARGQTHAQSFTWDETARKTWDVYRQVAG